MKFGEAVRFAEQGKRITRTGWNGKGMWVRFFDPYTDKQFSLTENENSEGTWLPFLIMKTVDNGLVPWLASQTDILANDWQVLDEVPVDKVGIAISTLEAVLDNLNNEDRYGLETVRKGLFELVSDTLELLKAP